MRYLQFFLFIFCGYSLNAFSVPLPVHPPLPEQAAAIDAFVPEGWIIEHQIAGNLAADDKDDLVLVLRMADENNGVSPEHGQSQVDASPRMLVVLFAGQDNWRLVERDTRLIPPFHANARDKLEQVVIRRGTLQITLTYQHHARSVMTFTLRWQQDGFYLIGYDSKLYRDGVTLSSMRSINYLTHRILESQTDATDERKEQWLELSPRSLLKLDQLGHGTSFDPVINCENPMTTLDINYCMGRDLSRVEAVSDFYLGMAWQRYSHDAAFQSALMEAHKAWQDYAKAHCEGVYQIFAGGSIRTAAFLSCRIELEKRHQHDIWRDFLGFMDSTPPLLPEP